MNKISPINKLVPDFIVDKPAGADAFGSHQRVAEAVSRIIQENTKVKIIGLLGTWGSGKSTVVKLIRERVTTPALDNHKYHFFTYDAWLHQSDPPRRSFLEELIYFLKKTKLPHFPVLDKYLSELSGTQSTTITRTTPILSDRGREVFLSLLLLPLATQLAVVGSSSLVRGDNPNITLYLFLAVLFLVSAPLIVIIKCWFYNFLLRERIGITRWINKRFDKAYPVPCEPISALALCINRGIESNRNDVIRTPDPTSIEFQQMFQSIMKSVCDEKNRFVFVIDNLDRLPEEQAISFWSAIRSLFLGTDRLDCTGIENPYVPMIILPIDVEAIRRLFSSSTDSDDLAHSFIDKTFDITFHVARPIMSQWKDYLTKRLNEVLANRFSTPETSLIGLLFERFLIRQKNSPQANPTPREMNKLANAIGALCLEWEPHIRSNNISLASISYYVINQEKIDNNLIGELREGKDGIKEFCPNWQPEVSALHFGCEPKDALQITLRSHVIDLISSRKVEKFKTLLKEIPGSADVCRRLIEEIARIEALDAKLILNSAYLLDELGLPSSEIWVNVAWHKISDAAAINQLIEELDQETAISLKALFRNTARPNDTLSTISKTLERLDSSKQKEFPNHFFDCAKVLFDAASDRKIEWDGIVFPGNASNYLQVISKGENSSKEFLSCLKTKATDIDLSSTLANSLRTANDAYLRGAFRALWKQERTAWQPLINGLSSFIREIQGTDKNMGFVLYCLSFLRANEASQNLARPVADTLCNEGIINSRFNDSIAAKAYETAASAFAIILISKIPNVTAPGGTSWEEFLEKHSQLLPSLSSALTSLGYSSFLELSRDAIKWGRALVPVVQALVSLQMKDNQLAELPLTNITAVPDEYLACFKESDIPDFLTLLVENQDFERVILEREFDQPAIKLLNKMLSAKRGTLTDKAKLYIKNGLTSYPENKWTNLIEKGEEPISLMQNLSSFPIGTSLFDSLRKSIPWLFEKADEKQVKRWFFLCGFLEEHQRYTVYKDISDKVWTDKPPRDPFTFFSAGGAELIEHGAFDEPQQKADAVVRKVLISILSITSLEWINANAAELKAWVDASAKETQRVLKDKLDALLNQMSTSALPDDPANSNTKSLLLSISKVWNLSLPEKNKEANQSETSA